MNENTPEGTIDFRRLVEQSERLLEESRQIEQAARRASRRFHDLERRTVLALAHTKRASDQTPRR